MEELIARRLHRRRPRRDDDRAGRRAGRRRALRRPGPARGGRRAGVPQVVSLGALDMVNFGPRETVPERFRGPQALRPQPDGDADADDARGVRASSAAGSRGKLSRATGPTALFVPLRGVSVIATEGRPFHDPDGGRGAVRRRCAKRSADTSRCTSSTWTSTTRVRRRDGRPAPRADPRHDPGRGARAPARAGRAGRPIIGAGAGTGLSAKCAEARRRRPDHHLQLRPLPDGRARLAGRADALRRRERDRGRDGRARCCRSCSDTPVLAGRLRHRPVPADAGLPARS